MAEMKVVPACDCTCHSDEHDSLEHRHLTTHRTEVKDR